MPIKKELRHLYRGPAWNAAREACRDRAGDKCEACGAKNKQIAERRGRKAVYIQCGASHVNNVAGDNRRENLKWLCRGCHLRADALFHRETRATRKDSTRPLIVLADPPKKPARKDTTT